MLLNRRLTLGVAVTAIIAAPSAGFAATPAFSNQTAASGLVSEHAPRYEIGIECCNQLGGGAVGDFDNDGWPDVFHPTGGGTPDRLFINNGDGTFTDRAAEWGIALAHRSTAAAVGDFDADGWLDLYVASFGPLPRNVANHHKLYRNVRGERFVDVTAAMGLTMHSTISDGDGWGGAWGDYDLDGDLDLAVLGYKSGSANRLFRNDGDHFTDVTDTAGLSAALESLFGYSARFVDMDGDRYPELIWIGDHGTSLYFINNGDGTFTDFTEPSGTSMDTTEMGMHVADHNGDGRFDFYVTTIETNNLYINQGGHVYLNEGDAAGVADTGVGWGTVAIHLDHDTRVDIVATALTPRQFAFLNTTPPGGAPRFVEVAEAIGIDTLMSGRGLANFDYDNDGDQDLVFFPNMGPIELYRNDLSGADTGWLEVELSRGCETTVPPQGIGSVVKIRLGDEWISRRVDGGTNYVSQSEMTAHFGLGAHERVDELRVEWSDGRVTTRTDVAADQTVTVSAGDFCGYCEATPNSTGEAAEISVSGSPILADNQLTLRARNLPPNARAVVIAAPERDFEEDFRGSDGNRCLTRPGRRVNDEAIDTGDAGEIEYAVDLDALDPIRRGETWHFQLWFDDGASYNSTPGASAAFR